DGAVRMTVFDPQFAIQSRGEIAHFDGEAAVCIGNARGRWGEISAIAQGVEVGDHSVDRRHAFHHAFDAERAWPSDEVRAGDVRRDLELAFLKPWRDSDVLIAPAEERAGNQPHGAGHREKTAWAFAA